MYGSGAASRAPAGYSADWATDAAVDDGDPAHAWVISTWTVLTGPGVRAGGLSDYAGIPRVNRFQAQQGPAGCGGLLGHPAQVGGLGQARPLQWLDFQRFKPASHRLPADWSPAHSTSASSPAGCCFNPVGGLRACARCLQAALFENNLCGGHPKPDDLGSQRSEVAVTIRGHIGHRRRTAALRVDVELRHSGDGECCRLETAWP